MPREQEPANSASEGPKEGAQEAEPAQQEGRFHVVGVGASAGGIEALEELLKALSSESIALLVVQHLSPNYESTLPQLLGRKSNLPVVTAEDGMAVERGHVCVGARRFSEPGLLGALEKVFASGNVLRDQAARLRFPGKGERPVRLGASQIQATADGPLLLVSIELAGDLPAQGPP